MDAIVDVTPLYLQGFLQTLALLGDRRSRGVHPRCARGSDADLACTVAARLRDGLHRGAAQHPAAARAVLLRVRAAHPRLGPRLLHRSPLSGSRRTPHRSSPRRCGPGSTVCPVGQAEAARSIGMGFGANRHARRVAASGAHGRSALDQRLHRVDQEHVGGWGVLRGRVVRATARGHSGQQRCRHSAAVCTPDFCTCASPFRSG